MPQRAICRRLATALTALCVIADTARGAPTPEMPSSREEVAAALQKVAEEYGHDAVRLQSHLLQRSLEGGSILAASAGVGGIEEYQQKRFMIMNLETGIVYNDAEGQPEQYPASVWRDVVEPTLMEFTTLEVPADGIMLRITYQHAAYRSRDQILALRQGAGLASDVLTLRLPTRDVLGLARAELTPSEVLGHTGITLNGKPTRIDLGPAGDTPAPRRPTPAHPLLP